MFRDRTDTLIIAEIGNNHEGDMAVARDLVARAADTGVDAVKFQTFIPEHYNTVLDAERIARLEKFRLSFDQFAELADLARAKGLMFFSTPFDLESARFLGTVVDAVKIASGDNTFYPLIAEAARTGKPMIISTGIADRDEIAAAVACANEVWDAAGRRPDLALLHCVVSYPAPPEEANMAAVASLARAFPEQVIGYSDHTIGPDAARLAVALGARVVEKHFTLANDFSDFRDHQVSADPAAMTDFVRIVRETEAMLGSGEIGTTDCEEAVVQAVRRSIVAARDLPEGTVLQAADITWVRPGGGIPPGREDRVLGRRLTQPLKRGVMVLEENLDSR